MPEARGQAQAPNAADAAAGEGNVLVVPVERQEKICWVCFFSETENDLEFINPCLCRGTTKWVHIVCLQRWIDEKQNGDRNMPVYCPQCRFRYVIVYPRRGLLPRFANTIEGYMSIVCPVVVGGIFASSVYWNGCTFGMITVIQCMGTERGLRLLENAHPFALLGIMPMIPAGLLMFQTVPWHEGLFGFMRRMREEARHLGIVRPPDIDNQLIDINPGLNVLRENIPEWPNLIAELPVSRMLCGAILFPTAASLIGKLFCNRIKEDLYSTLLGGFILISIKGAIFYYMKSTKRSIRSRVRVISYTPEHERRRF